jgi:hypothetical protein
LRRRGKADRLLSSACNAGPQGSNDVALRGSARRASRAADIPVQGEEIMGGRVQYIGWTVVIAPMAAVAAGRPSRAA